MGKRLTHVPLDIETSGFETTAKVTVVGFTVPLGSRVFVNTGGQAIDIDALETQLGETFKEEIKLSAHKTEPALLESVATFAEENLAPHDYLLVAYNGERFNGGFDLPFLRTRYTLQNCRWPFDGLPYADLLPLIQNRFNTTIDGEEHNGLVSAYDTLIDGDLSDHDPFNDSQAAVDAFQNGRFKQLLAHNLADILRTKALANLAEQYCGKSEFNLKSLTPSARDPSLSD